MTKIISSIQIESSENGFQNRKFFGLNTAEGDPLDQFCRYLIQQGLVDSIKYAREFSLKDETTRALTGGKE